MQLSLLLLALTGHPAKAQDDALAQQRQAVQRLDQLIEQARRDPAFQLDRAAINRLDPEFEQSNARLAAQGAERDLARGLLKRGSIARLNGQRERAVALYTDALRSAQRARDAALLADAMGWLAFAHLNERRFQQALALTRESAVLAESNADMDVLARVLEVQVNVLVGMGDLNAAAVAAERQLAAAQKAKDPMAHYYALSNRADVALKRAEQCDFRQAFDACLTAADAARDDLLAARDIAVRLGFEGLRVMTDGQVMGAEQRRKLVEMRRGAAQSEPLASRFHPKRPEEVLVTEFFLLGGRSEHAPMMRAAQEELQRLQAKAGGVSAEDQARLLYIEGSIAEAEGRNDDALALFMKSVAALERDRGALREERARNSYLENRVSVYYAAVRHLLQRQRLAEAFEVLERSRSRALAELLAGQAPSLRSAADRALIAEAAGLRARIAETQKQWVGAPGTRAQALAEQTRQDEARYSAVLARIQRESPRLMSLVAESPATLQALQASMRAEGYEVLQYLVTDSALIVWHIAPDAVYVRNVFLPRAELMKKVAALRTSLASPAKPYDDTIAGELYLYLVQPFVDRLRGQRLVIVPHEDLNGLSYAALRQPQTGRFFGERMQISYAPSASVLLKLQPSTTLSGARVVAYGDPGLFAQNSEFAAIQRLFGNKARVQTTAPPPKLQLIESLAGFDVVHLAFHGKYEAAEPMRSHLLLRKTAAAAAPDEDRLTAAEMFGLPLDGTRLVVLSACESGRTDATYSNETLGMSRGLLYAGAQSLLLSQWAVDSEVTGAWMQAFYESAQRGTTAEAVRAASLQVKESPGRGHPFYWAAFTLLAR